MPMKMSVNRELPKEKGIIERNNKMQMSLMKKMRGVMLKRQSKLLGNIKIKYKEKRDKKRL